MPNGNLLAILRFFDIAFNIRFESLNSRVRTFNVFSNRLAPSRDIVCHFSVLQHLRFYCHDGQMMAEERYV